jgi:hypothetical protein
MSDIKSDMSPLGKNRMAAGFVSPVLGRTALRDVHGYFNFPLITKGEVVTEQHFDRAQSLGKLYELIAATDPV